MHLPLFTHAHSAALCPEAPADLVGGTIGTWGRLVLPDASSTSCQSGGLHERPSSEFPTLHTASGRLPTSRLKGLLGHLSAPVPVGGDGLPSLLCSPLPPLLLSLLVHPPKHLLVEGLPDPLLMELLWSLDGLEAPWRPGGVAFPWSLVWWLLWVLAELSHGIRLFEDHGQLCKDIGELGLDVGHKAEGRRQCVRERAGHHHFSAQWLLAQ